MFFESLFEGSFRFVDVTGFTVLARQLVYYNAFVLGMVLVFRGHYNAPDGGVGLACAAIPVFLIMREMGSVTPPM